MTVELFLKILKEGGPIALAIVACWVCVVLWRKLEAKDADHAASQEKWQDRLNKIQEARLRDMREDRATFQGMTEEVVSEMTQVRIALGASGEFNRPDVDEEEVAP